MHPRHDSDEARPNVVVRVLRGLVFLALFPAILVAGLIMLPVVAIARLVGLGPRGRGCTEAAAATRAGPADPGDVATQVSGPPDPVGRHGPEVARAPAPGTGCRE